MLVIMKRPGEIATIGELTDVRSMQEFVCGHFETVPLSSADGSSYLIVCNDNFLNDGSKFNMSLGGVQFFGNFFICKTGIVNGEPDFVGLDPVDILNIADNLCWSRLDVVALEVAASELNSALINVGS